MSELDKLEKYLLDHTEAVQRGKRGRGVNTYTNTYTSSTPCSVIEHYCKLKGFMCEYANENGYCGLTACAYTGVVYRGSTIVKTRILKESEVEE